MKARYGISCIAVTAGFLLFASLPAYSQSNTDISSQLSAAYYEYLGRAPDQPGLEFWTNSVTSGQLSLNDAIKSIATSPEAKAYNVTKLTNAYHAYLGRAPDQPGLEFWTNNVMSGQFSLNDAIKSIATSPEAKTYNIAKLTNAYQTLLGHAPDPEGLAFWTDNIMDGKISLDDAILSIAQIAESEEATMQDITEDNTAETTNADEEDLADTNEDSNEDPAYANQDPPEDITSDQENPENNIPASGTGNNSGSIHISINGNVISISGIGSDTVLSISNSDEGIVLSISVNGNNSTINLPISGISNTVLSNAENGTGTILSNSGNNDDTASGSDEEQIIAAYQEYLGRDPDNAGLEYWKEQISSGLPLEDAIKGISESSEARRMAVSSEIVEAFENYLGRTPGENEKNYWLAQVLDGKISLEDAISQIRGENQDQKEASANQDDGTDTADAAPDTTFYLFNGKPYARYGQHQGAFHHHGHRSNDRRFRNTMSEIDRQTKERSDRRALGDNQGSGTGN